MSPGLSVPESNPPGVSDVTVWATWPLFVQQTVPPVGMFTVCGSKKLSKMSTSTEPTGQAGPPLRTSFSTLAIEIVAPSRPPAAISVLPTAVPAVNERCALSAGAADHVLELGLNLTTSVVVSGVVKGLPPPIAYNWP